MKNKWFISGILSILLVFGLLLASCDGEFTYTVTFSNNGGNGAVLPKMEALGGTDIDLPDGSGLSKSGYIFGGWNTKADGTGTNYSANSAYTVNGNVTLYAKWDKGLAVKGIPEAHEGKWAFFYSEEEKLYGAQSVVINAGNTGWTCTAVEISGGSVNLPLWTLEMVEKRVYEKYTGSDTVKNSYIYIYSKEVFDLEALPTPPAGSKTFTSITFTEGSATVNW